MHTTLLPMGLSQSNLRHQVYSKRKSWVLAARLEHHSDSLGCWSVCASITEHAPLCTDSRAHEEAIWHTCFCMHQKRPMLHSQLSSNAVTVKQPCLLVNAEATVPGCFLLCLRAVSRAVLTHLRSSHLYSPCSSGPSDKMCPAWQGR